MSKASAHSADYLAALFYGDGFPQYGDTLWISGHSSDPGKGGDQDTNELDYPAYRRVGLKRNRTDWLVEGETASNLAHVVFSRRDGGTKSKLTHIAVGTEERGAGRLLRILKLKTEENLNLGRAPLFLAGQIRFTEI